LRRKRQITQLRGAASSSQLIMGCGITTTRYIVFLVNILIFLLSLVIVGAGGVLSSRLSGEWFHIAYVPRGPIFLTIIVGASALIISFLGCCGAAKESPCLLTTYAVTICLLLMTELVAAGLIFHFRNNITGEVKGGLRNAIRHYGDVPEQDEIIDSLQWTFKCCGLDSREDWKSSPNGTLPASCCPGFVDKDRSKPCHDPYERACLREIESYFYFVANAAGIAGILIAIIQLAAIISSCLLAKSFRKRYHYV